MTGGTDVIHFRHSGQAALAAQTRNRAARESANLSRTPLSGIVPEQIAFGAALFRVSAALRPE